MGGPPSRARKIITRVIVFLLLIVGGAIVNVAVAWGSAATSKRAFSSRLVVSRLPNGTDWYVYREGTLCMTRIVLCVCGCPFNNSAGLGVPEPSQNLFSDWSRIRVPVLPSDSDFTVRTVAGSRVMSSPGQTIVDEAFGFPLRSLWCGWGLPSVFSFAPNVMSPTPILHGIELKPPNAMGVDGRALPYAVIWPGFAVNTVFYAGILWMLFAAPFALRRRRRIKRGLCPACAYPVGDSPVCTECGAAVKRANARTQASNDHE